MLSHTVLERLSDIFLSGEQENLKSLGSVHGRGTGEVVLNIQERASWTLLQGRIRPGYWGTAIFGTKATFIPFQTCEWDGPKGRQ